MRCPGCGTEAAESDKFCPKCGAGLQGGADSCVKCGSALKPDSTYCAQCGMAVPRRSRPVEALSKSFFLGSMVGGWVLGYAMVIGAIFARSAGVSIGLGLFSTLPMVYAAVVFFVLWYKAWESVQDGHVRTTPCRAVGFMFIPFFNLYWLFQVVWGFARDYNSFIVRHRISTPDLNEGLFLAVCILSVVSFCLGWIPFFGYVLVIALMVLIVIVANAVVDGVNRLAQPA